MGERPKMDAKQRKDGRRQCCECGRKYQPKPSAKKHQKTCCEKCRRKRRAGQARDRYTADVSRAREAARRRQQKSRERRRAEGPEPPKASVPPQVIRVVERVMAGLPSTGALDREQVEQALYRVALESCQGTMSRAGLGADSSVQSTG